MKMQLYLLTVNLQKIEVDIVHKMNYGPLNLHYHIVYITLAN